MEKIKMLSPWAIVLGTLIIAGSSGLPLYYIGIGTAHPFDRNLRDDEALVVVFGIGCVFAIIYGFLNNVSFNTFLRLKMKAIAIVGVGTYILIEEARKSYKTTADGFYYVLAGALLIIFALLFQMIAMRPPNPGKTP